jgi:hypothetical protein
LAAVTVPSCVPGWVTPPAAVAAVLEAAVRVSVPAVPPGTTLPNARSTDDETVIGRTTVAVALAVPVADDCAQAPPDTATRPKTTTTRRAILLNWFIVSSFQRLFDQATNRLASAFTALVRIPARTE